MLGLIEISKIKIPQSRQRSEPDLANIQQLCISIQDVGFNSPILVQRKSDGYILISGLHRLEAVRKLHEEKAQISITQGSTLPLGFIPALVYPESTDEGTIFAVELNENLLRVPLSPSDRVRALMRLREIRLSLNPKETEMETSKIIAQAEKCSVQSAAKELSLAKTLYKYLETDEDIFQTPTLSAAAKKLKQKITNQVELQYVKTAKVKIYNLIKAEFQEYSANFRNGVFQLIISDPPNFEAARFILAEGARISTQHGFCIIFCPFSDFIPLQNEAIHYHWDVYRHPLIWYRGRSPNESNWLQHSYEIALVCRKPDARLVSDIADILIEYPKNRSGLFSELISSTCLQGDRVLDPYCKEGSIFPAGRKTKTLITALETNPVYLPECEQAMERAYSGE